MSLKKYIATGFQGNIHPLGVAPRADYEYLDFKIANGKEKGFPQLTPIVETTSDIDPVIVNAASNDLEALTNAVGEHYRKLVDQGTLAPGPFGDLISILDVNGTYVISSIGQKAYYKPGLAADLGIVLKGKNESGEVVYLVTGKRKASPGKGKPAWFGGFREVALRENDSAQQLDSSLYTALKEGFEEGAIKINCPNIEQLRTLYDADNVAVEVQLGSNLVPGKIKYLGTIKTADAELKDGGETAVSTSKRVHATSGYVCVADLGNMNLTKEELANWFQSGDDIASLMFTDITKYVKTENVGDLKEKLEFGVIHHNDFIEPLVAKAHNFFYN